MILLRDGKLISVQYSPVIFRVNYSSWGARSEPVGWGTVLQAGRSWVRFPLVSLEFFIKLIFPAALWPSNKNEYQKYFLGEKAASALGWQPYHLRVQIVLISGSLKILEPSGPVQAITRIAKKYFLETDGVTARNRQLASCWHQTACLPGAPEGVGKFEITGHLLSTGLVSGYDVTDARLRTSFRAVQISRWGIYISFEPLTSTLTYWQVIRRTHRREANCHLLATDTRHEFFLHLDSMLGEKRRKCQWWTQRGLTCTIRYSWIMRASNSG